MPTGPNDPGTAYPPAAEPFSLNVELEQNPPQPVMSFADFEDRMRMYLNVYGTYGEPPSETALKLTSTPCFATLSSTYNSPTNMLSSLVLIVEDNDGNTTSGIVSWAKVDEAFVRVSTASGQVTPALTVRDAASGEAKVSIFPSGDVESHVPGAGFVLQSPNGTRYRIKVADGGALSAVAA